MYVENIPEFFLFFQASWGHGFPVAGFLTAFGFFVVLTMEQIVLDYKETASPGISSPRVSFSLVLAELLYFECLYCIPILTPLHKLLQIGGEGVDDDVDQVRRRGGSIVGVRDHPLTTSIDGSSLDPVSAVEADPHSSFRSVLLTAALSLHSVFEGLAIGLQPDVDSVMQVILSKIYSIVFIYASTILHQINAAFFYFYSSFWLLVCIKL